MRTILQVPVDPKTRLLAEKFALNEGFSSLQESLRIIMNQMAQNRFHFSIFTSEPDEILTPAQEAVLLKKVRAAQEEKKAGRYFESDNIKEIMDNLNNFKE